MIPQAAVRKFIARARKDFRYYKKLSEDELEERVLRLPVKPPIWCKLRRHQKVCFLLGVVRRSFGFFLATGSGKTLLSIALVRYFYKFGLIERVLVLVPNRTNKDEWADQIDIHSPKSPYIVLIGSSQDKWRQLEANPDSLFIIETYAGFARMVCSVAPGKKGKNKLYPDPEKLKRLRSLVQGLILDESNFVKNRSALPYRLCRQISKWTKIVFALTGTPFGREPVDLWAQLHLIDKGQSLGETLGLFRETFYNKTNAQFGFGFDYKFKKSMSGTLNSMLAHSTIRYSAEAADLPRVSYVKKVVRLYEDAEAYYREARGKLLAAGGNPFDIRQLFVRMRQISSGFIGYRTEEDVRSEFEFDPNAKLESLLATIESIDTCDKFIVFHEFIPSGDMICRELKKKGVTFVRLGGLTKDTKQTRHTYNNDPKCQGLVMNHAAGGYGLNLQVCKYGLVYESPLSLILRHQIEARFIRQYSKHDKVFLYDFVAKGTCDQRILDFHKSGRDIMTAVLHGEEKL